jgi:hypothetical protein
MASAWKHGYARVTGNSRCDNIDESAYLLVMDVPMANEEHDILES